MKRLNQNSGQEDHAVQAAAPDGRQAGRNAGAERDEAAAMMQGGSLKDGQPLYAQPSLFENGNAPVPSDVSSATSRCWTTS